MQETSFEEWWDDYVNEPYPSAQELISRMCAEVQNVPSYCERFMTQPIFNEQGEELHTADRPFCRDMRCECHHDSWRWQAYIYQPWLDGILTMSAAAALFSGRQL